MDMNLLATIALLFAVIVTLNFVFKQNIKSAMLTSAASLFFLNFWLIGTNFIKSHANYSIVFTTLNILLALALLAVSLLTLFHRKKVVEESYSLWN
jgi:hypothetical protein